MSTEWTIELLIVLAKSVSALSDATVIFSRKFAWARWPTKKVDP
jgi:hypothetical protein